MNQGCGDIEMAHRGLRPTLIEGLALLEHTDPVAMPSTINGGEHASLHTNPQLTTPCTHTLTNTYIHTHTHTHTNTDNDAHKPHTKTQTILTHARISALPKLGVLPLIPLKPLESYRARETTQGSRWPNTLDVWRDATSEQQWMHQPITRLVISAVLGQCE